MEVSESQIVDRAFTKSLPKIELHAHLSGSISRQCLHKIWQIARTEDPEMTLEDPLVSMPIEKVDYDINEFFPLFSKYIYRLCNTKESILYATMSVLEDFEDDGVKYLELRTTPRKCGEISKNEYVSLILDCIDELGRESMSAYLLLSVDRANTTTEAMEVVDLAIEFRDRGVVGIDLCGNPLKGDISIYREAFSKAKEHGLKLALHFAEVPASSSVEELQTLLSFKPERLGHVINVPDSIKEEIIKRKLGLELCLTCNVNAKMISGGFAEHHFKDWQGKGCPLILCTDDVGIFCSSLSNEYLLAAEHFGLCRQDLLRLCGEGIDCIFGGEEDKRRLRMALMEFETL